MKYYVTTDHYYVTTDHGIFATNLTATEAAEAERLARRTYGEWTSGAAVHRTDGQPIGAFDYPEGA